MCKSHNTQRKLFLGGPLRSSSYWRVENFQDLGSQGVEVVDPRLSVHRLEKVSGPYLEQMEEARADADVCFHYIEGGSPCANALQFAMEDICRQRKVVVLLVEMVGMPTVFGFVGAETAYAEDSDARLMLKDFAAKWASEGREGSTLLLPERLSDGVAMVKSFF